jgi:hypothetical protein
MMPVGVSMLVAMLPGLVLMLLAIVAVGTICVAMFVLMLVLVVATHRYISSFSCLLI